MQEQCFHCSYFFYNFADQKSGSQPTAPALDNNAFKAAMDKFREDQKVYQNLMLLRIMQ